MSLYPNSGLPPPPHHKALPDLLPDSRGGVRLPGIHILTDAQRAYHQLLDPMRCAKTMRSPRAWESLRPPALSHRPT